MPRALTILFTVSLLPIVVRRSLSRRHLSTLIFLTMQLLASCSQRNGLSGMTNPCRSTPELHSFSEFSPRSSCRGGWFAGRHLPTSRTTSTAMKASNVFLFVIVCMKEILMVIGRVIVSSLRGYQSGGILMRTILQPSDLRGLMNRIMYFWTTLTLG